MGQNATDHQIYPLLLCGGSGTRLWPLSRKSYPKQFARLTGEHSLFQKSALRLTGTGFAPPVIVTASDFRFVVLEQLAAVEIMPGATLIEPDPRNTAPAILAGALTLHAQNPDALVLVAPSDHVIPDDQLFRDTVFAAAASARSGKIVTFGIRPDRAETGYGWLRLNKPPSADFSPEPQELRAFVEKPDRDTARRMLEDPHYLWNAGIFLFSAKTLIDAFTEHAPEMLALVQCAVKDASADLGFLRLATEPWTNITGNSIDFAVMEKATNLSVVPFGGAWSDLGDWNAVWRDSDANNTGNVERGTVTSIACENSLLRSEAESQALVGIGLKDIIAVAMPDAVLVAHRDHAQDVKQAVEELKANGTVQAEVLPRDYRPWGWFERLAVGPRFQVKRIVVKPNAALSLQSHVHRAEHWVVVEGTAKVTIGEKEQLVAENESVFVPLGAMHRLENPGKVDVVLIEVQSGSYLGEDDITRYDDIYARQGGDGA